MSSRARSGFTMVSKQIIEGTTLEMLVTADCLQQAWTRVRRNKGGPGGDGVTVDAFAVIAEAALDELRAKVLAETYRPRKVRFAFAPKAKGGNASSRSPRLSTGYCRPPLRCSRPGD